MVPFTLGIIGFLYNFNLSDSNKILVILNYNKKNLAFRCFTIFFDKFVFIFNKLETMVNKTLLYDTKFNENI